MSDSIDAAMSAAISEYKETNAISDDTSDTTSSSESLTDDSGVSNGTEDRPETGESVSETPTGDSLAAERPIDIKVEEKKEDEAEIGPVKDKHGRENRIPHSRVQKIAARAEKTGREAALKEFEPKLAQHAEYENRINEIGQVEQIMFHDQPRFISILRTIPGYAELLDPKPAATPATPASETRPGPDTENGYSVEGLDKLLQWQASQTAKQLQSTYDEKLKPILDKHAQEQHIEQMRPKIQKQMAEAAKWDGFTENMPEILAALKADPGTSLESAYIKVVIPKLKADEPKIREKVLKELKAAPTSTGTTPNAAKKTVVHTGPRDLDDVIRQSIKALR